MSLDLLATQPQQVGAARLVVLQVVSQTAPRLLDIRTCLVERYWQSAEQRSDLVSLLYGALRRCLQRSVGAEQLSAAQQEEGPFFLIHLL